MNKIANYLGNNPGITVGLTMQIFGLIIGNKDLANCGLTVFGVFVCFVKVFRD